MTMTDSEALAAMQKITPDIEDSRDHFKMIDVIAHFQSVLAREKALVDAARNLRATKPTYSIAYANAEMALDAALDAALVMEPRYCTDAAGRYRIDRANAALATQSPAPGAGDADVRKAVDSYATHGQPYPTDEQLRRVAAIIPQDRFVPFTPPESSEQAQGFDTQSAGLTVRLTELVDEYEFVGDEGYYTPNERERMLLLDFAMGLPDELFATAGATKAQASDQQIINALDTPFGEDRRLFEVIRSGHDDSVAHKVFIVRELLAALSATATAKGAE